MKRTNCLGALAIALIIGAGCSDDGGGNQVCGNGLIEGTEICDMDSTGNADCISQGFAGGTLSCDSDCGGLDTSACTGDATCGNGDLDTGEDCDTSNLDSNDCTTVGNYTGGILACAGDCTFDTTNCTAPASCGNGTIEAGEDCDASNLDSNDCTTAGGGFAGGTLACAGDCTFDTGSCVTTSEQITAARVSADGTTNLPINGAWVTYLRDGHGTDPMGGFHVQSEQLGPALFVQADATTLETLSVGDEVSFDILEMDTIFSLRQAISIANLSVDSSGHNVSTLYQSVSGATDLVTALGTYESEVITLDATVTDVFNTAGGGYHAATIDTDGLQGDTDLLVRIPSSVLNGLGLAPGCQFTATGVPMWRFDTTAQVGIWNASDITVNSCDAPEVTGAVAVSAVDVELTFSTAIDAASLTNVPAQITFDQGVSAVSAVVNGPVVTVTTDGLSSGVLYLATVANSVTDLLGTPILATANSATFIAPVTSELDCADGLDEDADGFVDCLDTDCVADSSCGFGSQLYIWELDADQSGGDTEEFVELWNNTGGTVDFSTTPVFLLFVNGNDDLIDDVIQLSGTVNDGDVHVVGMAAVPNVDQTFTSFLQNGPDGVMLVSCMCDLSDFPANLDPTPTAGTFGTANGRTATVLDSIAYDTNDGDDAGLLSALGVSTQFDEGTDGSMSLIRTTLTSFMQATPTPGISGIQP